MKKDFSKMRDLVWTDEDYFNEYEETSGKQKIKSKKPSIKGEYNKYDSKKKKKK